jgi:glycosyltransferase involved in cell wall biosynthesis
VVIFAGVLAPHKGVGLLIDAWAEFREGRDVRLLLVGPASGFYRDLGDDPLSAAANDPTISILEHVQFEDMPGMYAAADLFALPTRAEGMPNSLLEALASGLAPLVSQVPGVIEVVEGVSGVYSIDEIAVRDIGDALKQAFEAHTLAGENRASRLPERYALTTIAGRYAQLYEELSKEHA